MFDDRLRKSGRGKPIERPRVTKEELERLLAAKNHAMRVYHDLVEADEKPTPAEQVERDLALDLARTAYAEATNKYDAAVRRFNEEASWMGAL